MDNQKVKAEWQTQKDRGGDMKQTYNISVGLLLKIAAS